MPKREKVKFDDDKEEGSSTASANTQEAAKSQVYTWRSAMGKVTGMRMLDCKQCASRYEAMSAVRNIRH